MPNFKRVTTVFILVLVLILGAFALIPSSSHTSEAKLETTEYIAADSNEEAEKAKQLEKEIKIIEYASAIETARQERIAIEWEAAAEAQRVFDAQAAEKSRQDAVRASQRRSAATTAHGPSTPVQASTGGSGCVIADYICQRESGHSYTAYNASSGAGGMYQLLPSTACGVGKQIGRPDLCGVPTHTMSPSDQDLIASNMDACHWNAPNYCA